MIPEQPPQGVPQEVMPAEGPPQMPPQGGPEMPPQGGPEMPPQGGPEMPVDGLMNMESQALQMDEVTSNETAVTLITKAKEAMYGERFDDYMEVLQGSENIVEDLAMISLDLIIPGLNATTSRGGQVPFDHLMDAAAEVVSEGYDMAVQTGVYMPSSEQELDRNQNITLTMVAGELGKSFSSDGQIPQDRVSNFIETVMSGHYDTYIDPQGDGTESISPEDMAHMVPQEPIPPQGPPMPPQGPPMGGPPMGGPPMPPQGPPMGGQPMPPQEEPMPGSGGLISG